MKIRIMEDAQDKRQQKRKDMKVLTHSPGSSLWPVGVPIFSFWKAQSLVPMGANLQILPKRVNPEGVLSMGDMCRGEGPGARSDQEADLPRTASSRITGERLLIRVKERSKLNVKVLSLRGCEPTDSQTWELGTGWDSTHATG